MSLVFELRHGTDHVAREVVPGGRFRREEVVMDQFLEGSQYLRIGATLEGVAEVLAVDLAVPEERAEAGVEDAGRRGEGEGPDLWLVPEVPDPRGILWALPARVEEERYLRQSLYH